ncbi:MAG: hypothetical protein KDB00_06625 [Planctomycetales bacterium]|nr:hypothetical protein [Planctomycetales bacterium]
MSTECRTRETCPYRQSITSTNEEETATCSLLVQITGVDDHPALTVGRDACEACCESYPPSTQDLNPVVASLLFEISEQIVEANGVPGCNTEKAQELNRWAEQSLPAVAPDEDDCVDIARKTYQHLSSVSVETIANHLPRPQQSSDESEQRTRVKTWAVGVTTSPRRLPTVGRCVESVVDSGWTDPVIFVDGDVELPASMASLNTCRRIPALGAFPNYVLSLAELFMRDPYADAYLMIQDDALFLGAPSIREYLESVLWPISGPCMASLYCSKKYNQESAGWHRFPGNWVWGAVSFVYSSDAVKRFLSSPMVLDHRALPDDQGLSKIDVLLGQFAVSNDIPVLFPSPSLVQHIGTVSTIWNVARAVNARHANQFIGDFLESP